MERLLAVCEAATPGPWDECCDGGNDWFVTTDDYKTSIPVSNADVTHIATFNPSTVRKLIEVAMAAKVMRDETDSIAQALELFTQDRDTGKWRYEETTYSKTLKAAVTEFNKALAELSGSEVDGLGE